jgi:hypothetical protein
VALLVGVPGGSIHVVVTAGVIRPCWSTTVVGPLPLLADDERDGVGQLALWSAA